MPDQTAQRRPVDDKSYAPLTDRAFAAFRWRLATLLTRLTPAAARTPTPPTLPDPAPASIPLPDIPPSLALVGATPPTPTTVPPASSPAWPLASVTPARTSSSPDRAVSDFSSVTGIGVGVAALVTDRSAAARDGLRTGEWVRAGQSA